MSPVGLDASSDATLDERGGGSLYPSEGWHLQSRRPERPGATRTACPAGASGDAAGPPPLQRGAADAETPRLAKRCTQRARLGRDRVPAGSRRPGAIPTRVSRSDTPLRIRTHCPALRALETPKEHELGSGASRPRPIGHPERPARRCGVISPHPAAPPPRSHRAGRSFHRRRMRDDAGTNRDRNDAAPVRPSRYVFADLEAQNALGRETSSKDSDEQPVTRFM